MGELKDTYAKKGMLIEYIETFVPFFKILRRTVKGSITIIGGVPEDLRFGGKCVDVF